MPAAGAWCCCLLRTVFVFFFFFFFFWTDRTNELTRSILRLPNCLRTELLLLFWTGSTTNSKGVNSTLVYCLYKHTTVGKTNHGIHFLLIVFNWNHFEMRLLNLRINFFFFCLLRTFVLILVVFVLFLQSLRFGQISPLAFFRWFTVTSDRNAESCNRIPSNYCFP